MPRRISLIDGRVLSDSQLTSGALPGPDLALKNLQQASIRTAI
ncbi:MAG TPA: hypothetical protein VGL22_19175 [Terracidiphilus sp.]